MDTQSASSKVANRSKQWGAVFKELSYLHKRKEDRVWCQVLQMFFIYCWQKILFVFFSDNFVYSFKSNIWSACLQYIFFKNSKSQKLTLYYNITSLGKLDNISIQPPQRMIFIMNFNNTKIELSSYKVFIMKKWKRKLCWYFPQMVGYQLNSNNSWFLKQTL